MTTAASQAHPLLPLGARVGDALADAGITNRVVIGTDATDDDWSALGALVVIYAGYVAVCWRTSVNVRHDFEPLPPGPIQSTMTDAHRRMYGTMRAVLLDEGLNAELSEPNREGDYVVAVRP